MKKSRFSEDQIVKILQEAESGKSSVEALCKKHGVAETTFYRWRAKYAGASQKELARLRDLERENARLKKILAERDLELDVLKEIASKKW
jgi:putative transposase